MNLLKATVHFIWNVEAQLLHNSEVIPKHILKMYQGTLNETNKQ